MVMKHIIVLVMKVQKIVIYQHNVAIMMRHFFYLGAKRRWCENLISQVDMCYNIFLDHIVQECFKTVYG